MAPTAIVVPPQAPKNVYQLIAAVAAEIATAGIAKDRKNTQQNYSFRGIDDVYNALAPILAKHGLVILPRIVERAMTERKSNNGGALFNVVVKAAFDFVSSHDGSTHVVETFGEAMDSADKATNKAMSAAYKYAAFQAFCIPTEGDNDADGATHAVASSAPVSAASAPSSSGTAAKPANGNGAKPANGNGSNWKPRDATPAPQQRQTHPAATSIPADAYRIAKVWNTKDRKPGTVVFVNSNGEETKVNTFSESLLNDAREYQTAGRDVRFTTETNAKGYVNLASIEPFEASGAARSDEPPAYLDDAPLPLDDIPF
jgi:hypothetical protein